MKTQTVKHTPGPWKAELRDGMKTISSHEEPYTIICKPHHAGGDVEANARLIAAAPELLEALEDLTFHVMNNSIPFSVLQEKIKKAQQAIAKAEGNND